MSDLELSEEPTSPSYPALKKFERSLNSIKAWLFSSEKRIFLVLYVVLAIELLLHFGHHSKLIGDPNYYNSMINVFLGNQSVSTFIAYYNRLQPYGATGNQIFLAFFKRPLSPFLASLVCRITGVSVGTGFSIITALYTIGAIYLFYKFLISIGIDKKITFLTVLLFINAFPMLVLCATDMTDMGGYFFALLELYFVFKYHPQFEQKNWKYYVILGLNQCHWNVSP